MMGSVHAFHDGQGGAAMRAAWRVCCLLLWFSAIAPAQSWVLKVLASTNTVLGNPLTVNPHNPEMLYGSPGNNYIYVSRNRGINWQVLGNPTPVFGVDPNIIKFIAVSPLDTNKLLVGMECSGGSSDRILRSTNNGLTWLETWRGTFSYYGRPVEFKPEHPDTVYTMGNDTLYRSVNFGSTWDTVLVSSGPGHFNMWCDAQIRRDSANVMFIGDAASGIWKTYDHGVHWKQVYASVGSGEIPSISIDPFDPKTAYATRFSGGGGLMKSTDWGESWQSIPTPIGASPSWWVTCSPVHPGYVYFGMYSTTPGGIFISRDGGGSWENFIDGLSISGKFNYGLLALDSLTVIALQANGIHRLEYPKSILVTAPNGGESYVSTIHHTIEWTQSNLYFVKLQFSSNNGATWSTIEDSIPPSQTTYDWTVPVVTSSQCRIRVVDQLYTSTADTSDAAFSITPFSLLGPNGGEVWSSGSIHPITWVASDFPTVTISYSSDSGATWNFIATRPSTSGSYGWLVPEISSTGMKIRIEGSTMDTTISVESANFFSLIRYSTFSSFLTVADNGAAFDTLFFGAASGATDSIDAGFGETELPAKPPAGTFDARWEITGTNGTRLDMRDTVGSSHPRNTFIASIQPGGGGFPMTVSWNPDSVSAGVYILRDAPTHGSRISADMRATGSVQVNDSSDLPLEIIHAFPVRIAFDSDAGWNLLSLPVEVGDRRRLTLFPYALSSAFTYEGSYRLADTIPTDKGFWIKSIQQMEIAGAGIESDTVPVKNGWNMIGSLTCPISTSSITWIGGVSPSSGFYVYDGVYHSTSTLFPGQAAWIKVSGAGGLALSCSMVEPSARSVAGISTSVREGRGENPFHSLRVGNDRGAEAELLFGPGDPEAADSYYELPPVPPEVHVDARFAEDMRLQLHPKSFENALEYPIYAIFAGDKINFKWSVENEQNFTYILIERRGVKEVAETRLTGHGSLLLKRSDQSTFTLQVQHSTGRAELPREFSLKEIYPNPFNPTARITFTAPVLSHVDVTVYSTLGERIATVADDEFTAGVHTLEWHGTRNDGISVSSGMYFIVMRATRNDGAVHGVDFSGVRKVLLLK